ncbi:MAG: MotA/TolQ/ExbB proton channel family protein [Planctomycetota bacterium]
MTPQSFAEPAAPTPDSVRMDSLFETIVQGGPVMIPLGICSVVALAWTFDRWLRTRSSALGSAAHADALIAALDQGGPAHALSVSRAKRTRLGAIVEPALERWRLPRAAVEKLIEDVGAREVRTLVSSLRPLTVVAVIAPLLGLLGTVVGIILAFRDIALSSAIGRPEALSGGIAQALVTTAAGLVIAIPTQAIYYWFRARIDRFARRVEAVGDRLLDTHERAAVALIPPAPPAAPPTAAASSPAPFVPEIVGAPASACS